MSKRGFITHEKGTMYEVPCYTVVDGKGIEETDESVVINFVRGSKLKDEEVEKRDGTLHEHILSVMIEDLKFKNSLVPSREGSLAITKLEEARMWMEERTKAREASGTLGTYKK